MKTYTREQYNSIPFFMKSPVTKEWIEESNLPKEYLGKTAILVEGEKIGVSYWIFEGVDFEIVS